MSLEYLGHEILDVRKSVDLEESIGLSQAWFVDRYQFDGTHGVARFFDSLFPRHVFPLALEFDTLDGYAEIRDFFKSHGGALYPFWLMLPCRTLVPSRALVGNEETIYVRHVGYVAELLASEGTFRHFFFSDGTDWNARKVASAVDGDDEDALTLDVALDLSACDAEDVEFYPLFFCRFTDDALISVWPELARHAKTAISLTELPRDYP